MARTSKSTVLFPDRISRQNEAVNWEFSIHVKSDDDLMYREPLTMDTRNVNQMTVLMIWILSYGKYICLKKLEIEFINFITR